MGKPRFGFLSQRRWRATIPGSLHSGSCFQCGKSPGGRIAGRGRGGEQSLVRHTPLRHCSSTSREARINPIMLWPCALRRDQVLLTFGRMKPRRGILIMFSTHTLWPFAIFHSLSHFGKKVFSSKIKNKCCYKSTGLKSTGESKTYR